MASARLAGQTTVAQSETRKPGTGKSTRRSHQIRTALSTGRWMRTNRSQSESQLPPNALTLPLLEAILVGRREIVMREVDAVEPLDRCRRHQVVQQLDRPAED